VDTLLRQFNGDLHLLSQFLKIMNNRMVLLNPNFANQQQDPNQQEENTEGENTGPNSDHEQAKSEAVDQEEAARNVQTAPAAEQKAFVEEEKKPEAVEAVEATESPAA
jgi:hypothetical protein